MSGGGAPQGRGGATIGRSEGESEEGGVGAFHTGNHTGQQPPGHPHGECAGSVGINFSALASVPNYLATVSPSA